METRSAPRTDNPAIPGKPVKIREALAEVPEFKALYDSADYYRQLIDTVRCNLDAVLEGRRPWREAPPGGRDATGGGTVSAGDT